MRVIFVPVADRPECALALNTAFMLGHRVGASIVGCHIRPHKSSSVALTSASGLLGSDYLDTEWQGAVKQGDAESAGIAAKELFTQMSERHDYELFRHPSTKPGAVWMEKKGSPAKVIGIMGPVADLLVVSRPATKGGKLAQLFVSAALLKSSRPILVLPQNKKTTVGKRISIAWNQSAESARAVAAAIPLLQQAENISIISCGPETQAGPKSGQLAAYLKYWGIKSNRVSTPGKDVTKELLAAYKSTKSDLMVMGAYSRSRMSRLIFGGVTEYMLKRATIPVLMLHA